MIPPQKSSFWGEICVTDKENTVNWELEAWVLVLELSVFLCDLGIPHSSSEACFLYNMKELQVLLTVLSILLYASLLKS